jgi:hypothetical protein
MTKLIEAQLLGGYGNHGGFGGQGLLRSLSPSCKPVEECRRDLLIGGTGVIAFIVVAGVACWFVLSGRWSLMLIELEQKIRSLRR